MPFKRTLQRYGSTPEPTTPHLRAGQIWDDRIGSPVVRAKNWRLATFTSLATQGPLIASLVWISTQSRIVPYVVEVDKLGAAQAVAPADKAYRPSDAQIAWFLGLFITDVRSAPTDPVLVRRDWLQAYDFVTDRAAVSLNDYARTAEPFKDLGERSVAVDITSVVRVSDGAYQVRWAERAYRQGLLTTSERWTAILSVAIQPPKSVEALRRNPLGLYIRALSWSREFDAAAAPPSPAAAPPPVASPPPAAAPLAPGPSAPGNPVADAPPPASPPSTPAP